MTISTDLPTYAACWTPPGSGAIATLAVRGPRAWDITRALFRPASRQPLPETPRDVGRFWFGKFGPEGIADDVVLTLKQGQPEPWLELHAHGGRQVVRLLLETLRGQGVLECSWPEWERRYDPSRAEALIALSHAATPRTAAILLDQYQGAFARALADIRAALAEQDARQVRDLLRTLAERAEFGQHLTRPWRVVVAGAPNVGKSSLINALAGYQRAVVSALPGTTRDVVTTAIAVAGWPVELTDTAGFREEAGDLEGQGIDLARRAVANADWVLWLLDGAAAPVWPTFSSDRLRWVINKIDLPSAWDWSEAGAALRISAHTGAGVAELCQAIAAWLVPRPPDPGAAVPFTARQIRFLEELLSQLDDMPDDQLIAHVQAGMGALEENAAR
ncbi:MAG: GTPase [Gemmataceae bacterium]